MLALSSMPSSSSSSSPASVESPTSTQLGSMLLLAGLVVADEMLEPSDDSSRQLEKSDDEADMSFELS